jgi:hypothetical protein
VFSIFENVKSKGNKKNEWECVLVGKKEKKERKGRRGMYGDYEVVK